MGESGGTEKTLHSLMAAVTSLKQDLQKVTSDMGAACDELSEGKKRVDQTEANLDTGINTRMRMLLPSMPSGRIHVGSLALHWVLLMVMQSTYTHTWKKPKRCFI